jgi:hypothetical protein
VGPVSVPASKPSDAKNLKDALASSHNPASSTPNHPATSQLSSNLASATTATTAKISALASNVMNATPTSAAELKEQLAEAKATIARLTSQLKDDGLRQRKTEKVAEDARERLTTGTTGAGVVQQTGRGAVQEGVPVQIVAGLCLLSFLVAYVFF